MDVERRLLNYRLSHVELTDFFVVIVIVKNREAVLPQSAKMVISQRSKVTGNVVAAVLQLPHFRLLHVIRQIYSVLIVSKRRKEVSI